MDSTSKPPPAPDPKEIIGLQNQYNRYNTSNPFGSTSWSQGENGHETQTTSLSPQMQQAMDRAFGAAATPYTKEYVPQGMDQIASAIMGKVGQHYGVDNLNTNLKQQGMPPPSANMPGQINGGSMGSPQMMNALQGRGMQGGQMGSPMQMGAPAMSSSGFHPGGNFANTGGVPAMGFGPQQPPMDQATLMQMFGGPGIGQIGPRTMPVGNQGS